MQKHNDARKTSGDSFLKNILLTFFEMVRKAYQRFYCVRSELEKTDVFLPRHQAEVRGRLG